MLLLLVQVHKNQTLPDIDSHIPNDLAALAAVVEDFRDFKRKQEEFAKKVAAGIKKYELKQRQLFRELSHELSEVQERRPAREARSRRRLVVVGLLVGGSLWLAREQLVSGMGQLADMSVSYFSGGKGV